MTLSRRIVKRKIFGGDEGDKISSEASWRRVMNRDARAAAAQETLKILERGRYETAAGREVVIGEDVERAVAATRLYRPADFPEQVTGCDERGRMQATRTEVTAETTLEAARRLAVEESDRSGGDVLCLNFASAKNPGGGFLAGSQAQEESLARSSALYPCLLVGREMYDFNRAHASALYSDYMIYSPRVPVFRDDDGRLLDAPYQVSFITAPAVNAGAVRRNEPGEAESIRPVMGARLARILWVAAREGHKRLVLGAWGCGVFANDPVMVAALCAELLGRGGLFHHCFARVVYAIYDNTPSGEIIRAFEKQLLGGEAG